MRRRPIAALDEDTAWAAVHRERLGLADLLADLDADEWARPSLCTGWTVRDVAAHLTLAHTGPRQVFLDMVRAGGDFDRMVAGTARRHAAVPTGQLVAEIRAMVGSRRHAPGITYLEPLLDVLVHGQDIAVPLGRPRTMPVRAAAAAATRVWTMGWPLSTTFRAPARFRGLELAATDVDWSVGEGLRVEGPVQALLLLLTGRTASAGQLTGAGVARLPGASA